MRICGPANTCTDLRSGPSDSSLSGKRSGGCSGDHVWGSKRSPIRRRQVESRWVHSVLDWQLRVLSSSGQAWAICTWLSWHESCSVLVHQFHLLGHSKY